MHREIKPFQNGDIDPMIDYFLKAEKSFLKVMGVDEKKLPGRSEWRDILLADFKRTVEEKDFYYLLWEIDSVPVGHSNINKILFGNEAYMHMHLWKNDLRRKGDGSFFCKNCIDVYFERFELDRILSEPYSENLAPNRLLARLGFEKEKTYITVPGWINFRQSVNRWIMSREHWLQIRGHFKF